MKVSFNKLEEAFTSANDEMYFWLDKKTGEVILKAPISPKLSSTILIKGCAN
ncbi:MAG TPA: hypothetical protein VK892_01980 [Pyrinomonadaceae bacterium]|nr:hypothetical protein [Pyrinomonadaceae bacterium]